MAENKNIVEKLVHDVQSCQNFVTQNPYNNSNNTEIVDALKNTIKLMEHKVAIQEKDIQNLTLQKENELQILMLQHENEILKLKNNEADQKKNEYTNKILKLEKKVADQVTLEKEKETQILKLENEVFEQTKLETEKNVTILQLEDKVADQAKQLVEKEKEIRKVEEENKLLRIEFNEATENLTKETMESFMGRNILFPSDMTKYFLKQENPSDQFKSMYCGWFQSIDNKLTKSNSIIHEEYVLVKVKCNNPSTHYDIYSYNQNLYDDQYTYLNILHKGWKHDTASVFILHPTHINKSIGMKRGKKSNIYHQWKVDSVPNEYRAGEDDFFIILFWKNKK